MKKIALSLAAVAAMTTALPVAAAPVNAQQARIEQRIEAGARSHRLSFQEAARLRVEARDIARLEARYRMGGLTRVERRTLDLRLARLDAQLTAELHDREFAYGYGRR